MPYNSYFPVGYQPAYYQQPQFSYQGQQTQNVPSAQPAQPQTVPQTITSGIIWVQGEAGAKSYLVAPNTTVQLWDSERQTIYIKSADASGMPSIKTLDYTIREIPQSNVSLAPDSASKAFATKDELEDVLRRIEALRGDLDGLMTRSARKAKAEAVNNE